MRSGGAHADAALRRDRPRPLVVGTGSPRTRADEARPQAPSLSRQVRSAARRGAARALRASWWAGPRPVRRLGDDARAGTRVRLRRCRRRHRSVQRAPRLGQDTRARPPVARRGCGRGGKAAGCVDRATDRLRRRVVRAAGRSRAAALPLADRGAREPGRAAGRARARRALGAPDDALRPRLPAQRRSTASTGATSTAGPAARSRAPASSSLAT